MDKYNIQFKQSDIHFGLKCIYINYIFIARCVIYIKDIYIIT